MTHLEILKYRYLAYFVLRDAIAFYFGIPKFLSGVDKTKVMEEKLQIKLQDNPTATDKQIDKYKRLIEKSVTARLNYLNEDYEFCKDVLFRDNLWLQLLDIDAEFLKEYLAKLPEKTIDELAIIPNWSGRDDDLPRPYFNSQRTAAEIKF